MNAIMLPLLYCPIEPAINPHYQHAIDHTNAWVKRFALHSDNSYEKYLDDNFGMMTARFYPECGPDQLKLANDANVLLFVMDDAMDNQIDRDELIQSRMNFEMFVGACKQILANPQPPESGETGVMAALADVWIRFKAMSNAEWQQRFVDSLHKMFAAGLWEYGNVQSGNLPSVAEFYKRRQYLGAAHVSTDMIEVIEEISLPADILQHPAVMQLVVLARNLVCWANDLFSLSKELDHGDQHNMVLVMKAERQLPLEAAILQAAELHDQEMRQFEQLSAQLPAFGIHDAAVRKYVRILGAILRGNMDWSYRETARYHFEYGHVALDLV
ncbi:terpene synthase family protein [Chitinophaga qingshengii]|uniref:Terpene synthase n=1 Tax=Chitinophaga qingshengii TaxID=1569794 RepID=A0ABR7TFQ7_9BACT|nr:hypothetical protein [Chitinophaga qingshengii]MBC9929210.1 hypothetical protein [Chitinophaga qingshengii]